MMYNWLQWLIYSEADILFWAYMTSVIVQWKFWHSIMDFGEGYVSNEHRELHQSATESADPLSVSPLQLSPKSSRSPNSPRSPKSPRTPQSPRSPTGQGKCSNLSPRNHRQSYFQKDGRPKKGEVFTHWSFSLLVFSL